MRSFRKTGAETSAVTPAPAATAQQPAGARFQDLKDPRISAKENQKMLVVEAKGDPNVIGGKALELLFQLLYYFAPHVFQDSGVPL